MSDYAKKRLEQAKLEPRYIFKPKSDRSLEREREYRKVYRKVNAGLFAHHTAARYAKKIQRRPLWTNLKAIREIYREARDISVMTGIKHHVDHIVPLISDVVSGLHVPWNLRIIPAEENVRKSNSLSACLAKTPSSSS